MERDDWDYLVGDVRDCLRTLKTNSVQVAITSPPYWGIQNFTEPQSIWLADPECDHDDWGLCAAPDDHAVKYWGCLRCGAWEGSLGMQPTPEMYYRSTVEWAAEVWRVLAPDGVLFMNIGDCYIRKSGPVCGKGGEVRIKWVDEARRIAQPKTTAVAGLKNKDMGGIPWGAAKALQQWGWWLRADNIWYKPNAFPRGSPDRAIVAHEYVFQLTKMARYTFFQRGASPLEKMLQTIWKIPTQACPEAHFATFPERLAEICILSASVQGDLVLDPFAGTGTVLRVARRHHRKAVGIDIEPYHRKMAERRSAVDVSLDGF